MHSYKRLDLHSKHPAQHMILLHIKMIYIIYIVVCPVFAEFDSYIAVPLMCVRFLGCCSSYPRESGSGPPRRLRCKSEMALRKVRPYDACLSARLNALSTGYDTLDPMHRPTPRLLLFSGIIAPYPSLFPCVRFQGYSRSRSIAPVGYCWFPSIFLVNEFSWRHL